MIKVNVLISNKNWKKHIKNPAQYIKRRLNKLNKKEIFFKKRKIEFSLLLSGKKEIRLGDLSPTRDFNYVTDTCNGLIQLFKSNIEGQAINIGSNSEISIKDLFKKIISLMGADVKCISEKERIRPESSEVYRLLCDNKFIKDTTNFESVVDLDQGLSSTIKWISEPKNLEIYKSEIYNV